MKMKFITLAEKRKKNRKLHCQFWWLAGGHRKYYQLILVVYKVEKTLDINRFFLLTCEMVSNVGMNI